MELPSRSALGFIAFVVVLASFLGAGTALVLNVW
jgi:hypothetical protein